MCIDLRNLIVNEFKKGTSTYKIAKKLNLPRSTMQSIIIMYKKTNSVVPRKNPGRPPMCTDRGLRALKKIVSQNRHTTAANITVKLREAINKDVSVDTCKRSLKKIGFKFYKVNLNMILLLTLVLNVTILLTVGKREATVNR